MEYLYSTGCRIGEACNMISDHIDFLKGEGNVKRWMTKTDAGERRIAFDIELSEKI